MDFPRTGSHLVYINELSIISLFHNGWNSTLGFNGKTMDKHLKMPFKSHLRNASCPCRTCLLLWVVQAMGGSFLLEQPRSSLLLWQPRMREFMKSLPKVAFGKTYFSLKTKRVELWYKMVDNLHQWGYCMILDVYLGNLAFWKPRKCTGGIIIILSWFSIKR